MTTLVPYLDLGGHCRQALDLYSACFGGEIVALLTFGDAPVETPPEAAAHIMHAEFRAPGVHFMATDGMPGQPSPTTGNVALCLVFEDADEQTRLYDALVDGGKATLPLHDAFWGDRFGMLTDRFGQRWMLSCRRA